MTTLSKLETRRLDVVKAAVLSKIFFKAILRVLSSWFLHLPELSFSPDIPSAVTPVQAAATHARLEDGA